MKETMIKQTQEQYLELEAEAMENGIAKIQVGYFLMKTANNELVHVRSGRLVGYTNSQARRWFVENKNSELVAIYENLATAKYELGTSRIQKLVDNTKARVNEKINNVRSSVANRLRLAADEIES